MASLHEIEGEEWRERAGELAEWAMARLITRKDIWGQYSVLTPEERRETGRDYKAMTLPQKHLRGADMVTIDKITRHFGSRHGRKPQIIGLMVKSKESTSRWFGIDIDCHDVDAPGAEDHARRNLNCALTWWKDLQSKGYDPLLFDSSGRGGYHLWVLFDEPAPTEDIFAMAYSYAASWEENNLDEEPETFPKKPKAESIGAWFRLPGLHPYREHYAKVWSGDEWLSDPWLSGHAAIDAMLDTVPGPPPPPAADAKVDKVGPRHTVRRGATAGTSSAAKKKAKTPTAAARKRRFTREGRATICVDLDGVLADRTYGGGMEDIGDPIPGAIEFTRELAEFADVVILTSRLSPKGKKTSAARVKKISDAITGWLDEHGFAYNEVCTDKAKPPAQAYIDDRGVSCRPLDDGTSAFTTAQELARALCSDGTG